MDLWINGSKDLWMDKWINGSTDKRIKGSRDEGIKGFMEQWMNKSMDPLGLFISMCTANVASGIHFHIKITPFSASRVSSSSFV
jgi:hypothetical protein